MIGPTDVEIRVLGCLIEKQRTTPDQYPLTLNSLRLACNQSTNREPVVDYDEADIRKALGELGRRRWIRGPCGCWRSVSSNTGLKCLLTGPFIRAGCSSAMI